MDGPYSPGSGCGPSAVFRQDRLFYSDMRQVPFRPARSICPPRPGSYTIPAGLPVHGRIRGKASSSFGPERRHDKQPHAVRGAVCTKKRASFELTLLKWLAERKGLEPSASGVTGRRYNRLNYRSVVGSTGLEPVTPAV